MSSTRRGVPLTSSSVNVTTSRMKLIHSRINSPNSNLRKSQYKVNSRPRGHISGAKLTFPIGKSLVAVPVQAQLVRVRVQEPEEADHWAKGLGGTERMAVKCVVNVVGYLLKNVKGVTAEGMEGIDLDSLNQTLYIDNEDNQTLYKITIGRGHPALGIRQMPIEAELPDDSIKAFYRVEHVDDGVYRIVSGG